MFGFRSLQCNAKKKPSLSCSQSFLAFESIRWLFIVFSGFPRCRNWDSRKLRIVHNKHSPTQTHQRTHIMRARKRFDDYYDCQLLSASASSPANQRTHGWPAYDTLALTLDDRISVHVCELPNAPNCPAKVVLYQCQCAFAPPLLSHTRQHTVGGTGVGAGGDGRLYPPHRQQPQTPHTHTHTANKIKRVAHA